MNFRNLIVASVLVLAATAALVAAQATKAGGVMKRSKHMLGSDTDGIWAELQVVSGGAGQEVLRVKVYNAPPIPELAHTFQGFYTIPASISVSVGTQSWSDDTPDSNGVLQVEVPLNPAMNGGPANLTVRDSQGTGIFEVDVAALSVF